MQKQVKRIFCMAVALALGVAANAANDYAQATFAVRSHDFGYIKEAKGPVSHTFEFENTGNKPLIRGKMDKSEDKWQGKDHGACDKRLGDTQKVVSEHEGVFTQHRADGVLRRDGTCRQCKRCGVVARHGA